MNNNKKINKEDNPNQNNIYGELIILIIILNLLKCQILFKLIHGRLT